MEGLDWVFARAIGILASIVAVLFGVLAFMPAAPFTHLEVSFGVLLIMLSVIGAIDFIVSNLIWCVIQAVYFVVDTVHEMSIPNGYPPRHSSSDYMSSNYSIRSSSDVDFGYI